MQLAGASGLRHVERSTSLLRPYGYLALSMLKRVLLLSASDGAGQVRAANALAEAFRSLAAAVEISCDNDFSRILNGTPNAAWRPPGGAARCRDYRRLCCRLRTDQRGTAAGTCRLGVAASSQVGLVGGWPHATDKTASGGTAHFCWNSIRCHCALRPRSPDRQNQRPR